MEALAADMAIMVEVVEATTMVVIETMLMITIVDMMITKGETTMMKGAIITTSLMNQPFSESNWRS